MTARGIFGTLDPFYEHGSALGRRAANAGFFKALLEADPFEAYHVFLPSEKMRQDHERLLAGRHPELASKGRFKILTRLDLPAALAANAYGVFHLSDCITAPAHLARLRNALARDIFPITSVTHSLSYPRYPHAFADHLWPGVTARDAVVATSVAGREVVRAYFRMLRQGLGLDPERFPAPRVEVLPLGVAAGDFTPATPEERREAREHCGLAEAGTVLLVFARVSHSSKMDLLPLLRALRRVVAEGIDPGGLCLAVAGWVEEGDQGLAGTLAGLAANLGLRFRLFARPSEEQKRRLYAGADIFVSLSDNVQETFGLTILEAMAAGLPVVASDFDGYRDLVVEGRTGYLAPTAWTGDTTLEDLLAPLCPDNQIHLLLAQQCAVDVPRTAGILASLIRDPALGRELGRAGRRRVLERFDWPRVVERYLDLWERLGREPLPERETLAGARHPFHLPYASVFAGYPSSVLGDDVRLVLSRTGEAVRRGQDHPVIYDGLAPIFRPETLRATLHLCRAPIAFGALLGRLAAAFPEAPAGMIRFHVLWSLKQDLLEPAIDAAGATGERP